MENTAQLALLAPAVTPLLTEETYTKLIGAFQAIEEAVVKVVEAVEKAISEFVECSVTPIIQQLMKYLYKIVAPPKLYHLAYHSKKGRTRKKNLKRIKCYWEEFINGCDKIR
nr:MAG TPA: actin-related protein 3 [Caudoviricetes sp.]